MSGQKILLTGVTGFMGGSFLTQLLASSNPNIKKSSFSALVRKQEQADILTAKGINAIIFSDLDDSDALKKAASEHDIVIHSANGFHAASAKALIEGLAERKKSTGGKPVFYIHTSGISNLADHPITKRYVHSPPTTRVFSDAAENIHQYLLDRETAEAYPQRTTDITVTTSGLALDVPTLIIMSPTVYGRGTGLFNTASIQVPILTKTAIARGQAFYVGPDGAGEWDHVHIEDLAALYELLLGKVLAGEDLATGEKGLYFSAAGKHSFKAVAEAVGKAGYELGALKTAEPVSVALEEFAEVLGGNAQLAELGFASRAVTDAALARNLGWVPKKSDADWWASFKEEFAAVLAQIK
ncbi:hypothetical protein B0J18DRAFT_489965 [Chaetomium sp. MPI-SDFR-AT-0129]|nr:hypothetical protein B0J18DRAFT_489965 [Chaetomium sp. MPI-SDFR-AT-0129]